MIWLIKFGVWILIAAALLLPLYELADYSEVWQHDGDIVVPGLFFLFSGMALVGARTICAALTFILLTFIKAIVFVPKSPVLFSGSAELSFGPPKLFLPVIFCDLRI
jgi:hypothetical protein